MSYLLEIVIVLVLIALNGIFSMSEFALVSSKKTRLRQRAEDGDTRAAVALKLSNDPTPFLSTVQIGITLIGSLQVRSAELRSQKSSRLTLENFLHFLRK